MSEGSEPKRIRLENDEIQDLDKDQRVSCWKQQMKYIEHLESRISSSDAEFKSRLDAKDKEIDDFSKQLGELRKLQEDPKSSFGSRSALLDPSINMLYQKLQIEKKRNVERAEVLQAELNAWKYTSGDNLRAEDKKLMAKCRQLLNENCELGSQLSDSRLSQIAADAILQKRLKDEILQDLQATAELASDLESETLSVQGSTMALYNTVRTKSLSVAYSQPAAAAAAAAAAATAPPKTASRNSTSASSRNSSNSRTDLKKEAQDANEVKQKLSNGDPRLERDDSSKITAEKARKLNNLKRQEQLDKSHPRDSHNVGVFLPVANGGVKQEEQPPKCGDENQNSATTTVAVSVVESTRKSTRLPSEEAAVSATTPNGSGA